MIAGAIFVRVIANVFEDILTQKAHLSNHICFLQVFMYGSAQAAIQHAIPWPRLGGRRDPPPPALDQRQAPRIRENEYWERGDAPQPGNVRNQFNHGLGAGDGNANAPQPNQGEIRTPQPRDRDDQSSMECRHEFVGRPVEVRTVRVETLRSAGNTSSQDNVDCQRRKQEQDPGIDRGGEPEAENVQKEKKKDVSTKDKVQKDAEDKTETEPDAPSQQIDVTTLGADQGSDVSIVCGTLDVLRS